MTVAILSVLNIALFVGFGLLLRRRDLLGFAKGASGTRRGWQPASSP